MNTVDSRLYPMLVVSLSIGLIASGAALLLWMMATTVGPFRFFADLDARTGATGLWLANDALLGAEGRAEAWQSVWPALGTMGSELAQSPELADLLHANTPLVIVPDARAISQDELGQLHRFVRAGGAALLSGPIAVRGPEGGELSTTTMRDVLRVTDVRELPIAATRALYPGIRGPLSAALAPGQTLRLRGQEGLFALREPDSELQFRVSGSNAASRRLAIGAGRLVWLAVGPQQLHRRDHSNQIALEQTLLQAVAWARRAPAISLLPWPGAAAFSGRVEIDERGERRATEGLRAALQDQLEDARRRAEHVVLYIPRPSLGDEGAFELAREMDSELKSRGAWIATSDEVWAWNRTRDRISASVESIGPHRLLVKVSNRGGVAVADVGLRIHINRPVSAISLSATTLGQDVPAIKHLPGAEGADFVVSELLAGRSQAFTVDYSLADSGSVLAFSAEPNPSP